MDNLILFIGILFKENNYLKVETHFVMKNGKHGLTQLAGLFKAFGRRIMKDGKLIVFVDQIILLLQKVQMIII